MSLKSWKKEFYPIDASRVKDVREAILHSLHKWQGLRQEALDRHGLQIVDSYIGTFRMNSPRLLIGSRSCALCHLTKSYSSCAECVLFVSRNYTSCDSHMSDEDTSPWCAWLFYSNPEPMIASLEYALYYYDKKESPK